MEYIRDLHAYNKTLSQVVVPCRTVRHAVYCYVYIASLYTLQNFSHSKSHRKLSRSGVAKVLLICQVTPSFVLTVLLRQNATRTDSNGQERSNTLAYN